MGTSLSGVVDGVPERFVPAEMRGQLVEAEHIARYMWAASFCRDKRVLDAGCGVGYGSKLIKLAGATEVVALDVAEAVIEIARQQMPAGVVCEVADIRSLAYSDNSFDVVVCFEMIEHVDEPDRVLDHIARVLRPDGMLLISSPNRNHYVPGNPHHKHEYTPSELRTVLESRFTSVRLLSQHAMLASVIGDSDQSLDEVTVERMVKPSQDDEIYTLAIAGGHLPPESASIVTLANFLETRQWLDYYQQQERILTEQARALRTVEIDDVERREAFELLAQREQELAEVPAMRERLKHTTEEIASLQGTIDRRDAALRELGTTRVELERLSRLIDDMSHSLSWRITAPLRAALRMMRRAIRRS